MFRITRLISVYVLFGFLLTACGGGGDGDTPATIPAGVIALPKTGQTICSDDSGVVVDCTGTGQDGELQTGVAEPSPRFTVDGSGNCVTDNLTGIMWTQNANLPAGAGAASTGTVTWQQALDFANSLQLCGFDDWRLPNRKELSSLVNYNLANNATVLNTLGFSGVEANYLYWSSSSYASSAVNAWIVDMRNGGVSHITKSDNTYIYVWPVRAGQ